MRIVDKSFFFEGPFRSFMTSQCQICDRPSAFYETSTYHLFTAHHINRDVFHVGYRARYIR